MLPVSARQYSCVMSASFWLPNFGFSSRPKLSVASRGWNQPFGTHVAIFQPKPRSSLHPSRPFSLAFSLAGDFPTAIIFFCPTEPLPGFRLGNARTCLIIRGRKQKKPAITRASGVFFIPLATGLGRTRDYSHSIVAGGLLLTSYVTRLMPRTSLIMRPEVRFSSEYGSSAQSAVMKSVVCTARMATTYS